MKSIEVNKAPFKAITLITNSGCGMRIVEALFKHDISMVDLHHARGSSIGAQLKKNGMPIETEQELVSCIVEDSKADEVFAMIYSLAEVDKPGGGFMYMQTLNMSTALGLPEDRVG